MLPHGSGASSEFPVYLLPGIPMSITPQRFVQQEWWFDLTEMEAWVGNTQLEYAPGMFQDGTYIALHLGPIWSRIGDRQIVVQRGMHCSLLYGPEMDCYERSSLRWAINRRLSRWRTLRSSPMERLEAFFKSKIWEVKPSPEEILCARRANIRENPSAPVRRDLLHTTEQERIDMWNAGRVDMTRVKMDVTEDHRSVFLRRSRKHQNRYLEALRIVHQSPELRTPFPDDRALLVYDGKDDPSVLRDKSLFPNSKFVRNGRSTELLEIVFWITELLDMEYQIFQWRKWLSPPGIAIRCWDSDVHRFIRMDNLHVTPNDVVTIALPNEKWSTHNPRVQRPATRGDEVFSASEYQRALLIPDSRALGSTPHSETRAQASNLNIVRADMNAIGWAQISEIPPDP